MKPFLGIDITTNRKNERLNGNERPEGDRG